MTQASRYLKGKLEARPYNGSIAFVAASFQLAILFQGRFVIGSEVMSRPAR